MENHQSLFLRYVKSLGVAHTSEYTERIFQEHPYKYSLYGLSKLLAKYHVPNEALRLKDKSVISSMDVPFIAEASHDLVIVKRVDNGQVCYDWYGEDITLPTDEFMRMWTGVVLIAHPDALSAEPEYALHKKAHDVERMKRIAIFVCLIGLLTYLGIENAVFSSWVLCLMALSNVVGAYLSYLLLQKQLHIQSDTADRICNLWKKSSCNNVLETPAAKLLGSVGWSEVGFAYFTTNVAVCFLCPSWVGYLGGLSVLSLVYAAWSIWYQAVKARSWCPLCLLVQGVFVVQAIVSFSYSYQQWRDVWHSFIDIEVVVLFICYALFLLLLNRLTSQLADTDQAVQWKYKYNSLKAREDVFHALQVNQPVYDISEASSLFFGKADASKTITVFSNPYCNPCAMMHKRLNGLLEEDCRVQYVFTYFSEELSNVNKYIIAAYQTLGAEKAWNLLTAWYDGGKSQRDDFFKKLHLTIESTLVEQEFHRHEAWRELTHFNATPTLLVNGQQLTAPYQVEDLFY